MHNSDVGITTEVATQLTCLLGAAIPLGYRLPAAAAVVVALLLLISVVVPLLRQFNLERLAASAPATATCCGRSATC